VGEPPRRLRAAAYSSPGLIRQLKLPAVHARCVPNGQTSALIVKIAATTKRVAARN
jgi:hypothetical protein